jgi:hypothetical protein
MIEICNLIRSLLGAIVAEAESLNLETRMKYILAAVACLSMGAAIVWTGSLMASCGNWRTVWLCSISERLGGVVLAPGIMAEQYSGSKLLALASDTLFYAAMFFLIFCFRGQRRNKPAPNPAPIK